MTTTVRNLKPGDVFTESGITVRIESIKRGDLVNGKENYMITAISIDYNKKMFKNIECGMTCYFSKKGDTKITIK